MNDKVVSNKRLNEHKKHTNIMIEENNKARRALSTINEKYLEINNIPEMYRDKIYDLYNNLSKQSIDFWSNDFILREPILFHLELKTLESDVYLKLIMEQLLLLPKITIKNRFLNEATYQSMEKEINNIKSIGEYILNYDIESNLNDTLIDYFKKLPVVFEKPQSITKKYQKIKTNIEHLGMIDKLIEKEDEILRLIEKKEEECLNYKVDEDILYKLFLEIQKLHEQDEIKNNQRTRNLKENK